MKYENMIAHICNSYHEQINPELKEDNSNITQFFLPDVVGDHRFVNNYGGYPRSEIAQILATEDINQQMALAQSLANYGSDDNPNAGLTDAQIMLGHRSKYLQTASEQISWLEGQLHNRDVQRQLQQSESSESKIKFEETEVVDKV